MTAAKLKYTIPQYGDFDGGELVKLKRGYSARIRILPDGDADAPWEMADGHGKVSEWTNRKKAPGERVIAEDRNSKRYYDFAAAIELAKRDGWDAPPYKTGTKGEQAVRAVEADFQYLRGWCAGDWQYVGVCVDLMKDDRKVASASLWSVESLGDYWQEVACELIDETLAEHAETVRRQRLQRVLVGCECAS